MRAPGVHVRQRKAVSLRLRFREGSRPALRTTNSQRERVKTVPNPRTSTAVILPPSLPPRGLSRLESAAYIGVSASLFDRLVHDGRMPKPKRIDGRVVWDRLRLDQMFGCLDDGAGDNPWDEDRGG